MSAQMGFGIPTPDEEGSSSGGGGGTVEIENESGDPITVEVVNPTADPETGLAKEAKQDDVITRLDDIIPKGSIRDTDNSTLTALTADEEWTGEWVDTNDVSSLLFFAYGLAALDTIELQWSTDGVSVDTDLLGTSDITTTETETGGFFVYLGNPYTTMIRRYVRVHVINGSTAQTTGFYDHSLWRYHGSSYPWTLQELTADLSSLSTGLLTRSVTARLQADGSIENDVASSSDPTNSSVTPLGPDAEFTGEWFDTTGFSGAMVLVESDVTSATDGILVEFAEQDADPRTVHRSITGTYDVPGNGLPRFFPIMQGEYYRVRYINGPIPQADFVLRTELLAEPAQLPLSPLDADVNGSSLSSMVRAGIMAPNDAGDWETVTRGDTDGLRVSLLDHEVETPIKPKLEWDVRGANVGSDTPVQLPMPPLTGVGTLSIQNEGDGNVRIAKSQANASLLTRRRLILPGTAVELDLNEDVQVWAIADDSGGSTIEDRRSGSTASGTATSPSNALTSDDSRATVDSGEDVAVDGFTSQSTLDQVSSVIIGFEGRGNPSAPSTETVAYVAEYDATGGNVGSLTSPTVTAVTDGFYLAAISTRNGSATVNSVTGMGLTWTNVQAITDDSGSNRISVWKGEGTATNGTVQAVFAATATNCTMKVTAWSGVDLASPIENSETKTVAGSSSSYTDSIDGTDEGMAYTAIASARRTHTPGSGFTELTKVNTGNGPNDNRLSVSYLGLTSTGSQTYSGSFNTNADWVAVALTLTPRPVEAPTVTLSYELDGTPGATSDTFELTDADAEYTLDITTDEAWVFADIADLEVFVTGTTVGAKVAQIDYIWVDETVAEDGTTQFVTVTAVGDA